MYVCMYVCMLFSVTLIDPNYPQTTPFRHFAGDSLTFNAVIGLLLIFACVLKTSSPEMGGFGGKMRKGWCDVNPQRTRFYFWGF